MVRIMRDVDNRFLVHLTGSSSSLKKKKFCLFPSESFTPLTLYILSFLSLFLTS